MRWFALASIAVLGASGCTPSTPAEALKAAAETLGVAEVKTLQVTGSGSTFTLGRNFTPDQPWPKVTLKHYSALIDYEHARMRTELLREMGDRMPPGGGRPFTGEQHSMQFVSGSDAWDLSIPAGGEAAGAPPRAQPQPEAAADRMLAIWATPHGFIKAAMNNTPAFRSIVDGIEVSFKIGDKYAMTGLVNRRNEVERVQTWVADPMVGDLLVETVYSGYKDFGGVLFPSRIIESRGGFTTLDLNVASVQANPAVDISVPDNVRGAVPNPVRVTSARLADGVYHLMGGGANSLAIEMRDHIVLVDTPTSEARAVAVIAHAKELMPNKPVRYVINTHHHWDHAGGIRAAMDEGATILTHETNAAFIEKVATMPRTLAPDRLSVSKKMPNIHAIGDSERFTDGNRVIEVYEITGNEHARGLLMVYLPKEKILANADAWDPHDPPGPAILSVEVQKANALYENIQRRGLDVQTIASMHGSRTTNPKELASALGKR